MIKESVITSHAQAWAGSFVIGAGAHLYVCLNIYVTPKKFEWHFSGDSPFQTLAVDCS